MFAGSGALHKRTKTADLRRSQTEHVIEDGIGVLTRLRGAARRMLAVSRECQWGARGKEVADADDYGTHG